MGKRKPRFNKNTVMIYIFMELLLHGQIYREKLLNEMEISNLTMYRYITDLKCSLSDLQLNHFKINSTPEKYIFSDHEK